ncbi:unnamed protein product [Cladocopium goreaui]|uniref:EamA domain-containing protein n=1 Tax=Cladocopium goreaui TaxID=2562237 RepID=A0A9P1BK55_9DINO|nr:unnamed protein product [Cladocopium goreaui]
MVGVIVTSAFGTLYLERQLKDPLFVQLHQLNAAGLTGALMVAMRRANEPDVSDAHPGMELDSDVPTAAPDEESPYLLPLRVALSVSCVVARGALNGSVLKKLDALTKGLIDVTAIVLCTVIQVLVRVSALGDALVCGNDCAGIAWGFEVQQLTFGGGCWGGFFALGLALSITAATSNVDSWRMHLELTCLRLNTSKFFLVLDFALASIQCIHFCVRTYTASLSMVGFVLEAISALFCLCLMLPYWGFAHCEGIVSGVAWMFMDRAIPDALMIGAIASLPVTEHEAGERP